MDTELDGRRSMGRYTVLKRLSVGGMAEVFLAIAGGPGDFRKVVTVKRILPDLHEDEEFVRLFLEEARISASLSHVNIAQVFDLGNEGSELFLAMEFVEGEDLSRIVKTTARLGIPIPIGLTSMIVRDVANALHYAHTYIDPSGRLSPIIHRDVTPKNIMVTYAGAVKVIDFGIAKMKQEGHSRIATSVKGSSGYISPEQLRGAEASAATDVFSLGVVLHELLTGQRLFKTDQPSALAVPEEGRIVPPVRINPAIPEALSDAVMNALAFDPRQRTATAKEFARAIEAAAPDLFDAERTANVMQVLFAARMDAIRNLVASARGRPSQIQAAVTVFEEQEPSTKVDPEAPLTTPLSTPAKPRVLAVDDSPSSLLLLKGYLGRAGFDVVGATKPADAFAALDSQKIDAIILDVMMPELDGYEMCRQIRKRANYRTTPILFLSAACALEERIRGLEVGGDDFIRKPCTAPELELRVRSHLARVAILDG